VGEGADRRADVGSSISLPDPFVIGEVLESKSRASNKVRPTELGELVRINFDLNDRSMGSLFSDFFKLFIRPLIEGTGKIVVRDKLKGVVVLRAD
jgi:hypothetical protein